MSHFKTGKGALEVKASEHMVGLGDAFGTDSSYWVNTTSNPILSMN